MVALKSFGATVTVKSHLLQVFFLFVLVDISDSESLTTSQKKLFLFFSNYYYY